MNANIVHSWRQIARTQRLTSTAMIHTATQFVPVLISSTAPSEAPAPQGVALAELAPLASAPFFKPFIAVELHCGTTMLKLHRPAAATAHRGAWTREVLARSDCP